MELFEAIETRHPAKFWPTRIPSFVAIDTSRSWSRRSIASTSSCSSTCGCRLVAVWDGKEQMMTTTTTTTKMNNNNNNKNSTDNKGTEKEKEKPVLH